MSDFIPRCNNAQEYSFIISTLFSLLEVYSDYHQIMIKKFPATKTPFVGPHRSKYIYNIMQCGLLNGLVVFTIIIYNLREYWNQVAENLGVNINGNTDTRIIIENTFGNI